MTEQNMRDQSGERRAVRRVIRALKAAGFQLIGVNDGFEIIDFTMTETRAIDHVFSVDVSTILFRKHGQTDGKRYGVLIVLGNADDGSEVVADHSDDTATGGSFTKAIDQAIGL